MTKQQAQDELKARVYKAAQSCFSELSEQGHIEGLTYTDSLAIAEYAATVLDSHWKEQP